MKQEKIAIFLANLNHPDAVYRWGAAEALGRIGDERVVDALIVALKDTDWRVRMKAAWSLGQIGEPRSLPHLMRLMRDENETVQEMARESVTAIQRQRMRSYTGGAEE